MFKFKSIIIIFLPLLIFNVSNAQNIAYANLDQIIKSSSAGKDIVNFFNDKNKKLVDKIKNKEKEIQEKERSLVAQKNILEPEEFQKKINLLKDEIINFNKTNDTSLKNIKLEKEKVLNSFLLEINKILKEFAETNNIDIIFSSSQMLIGKSNLDVTKDLLDIVNKKIENFKLE